MPDEPTPTPDEPKPITPLLKGWVAPAILILLAVLMIPAAWYLPRPWSLISVMILMIVFLIVLGLRICGRPAGILINDRNLVSLSRFQLILWTVLILSAFLTAVMERLHHLSGPDPLAIMLKPELWALLGISTASLVGTPLIESTKKTKEPKDESVAKKAGLALNESPGDISNNAQGLLYANTNVKDASFTDMFQGEEVGNTAYVDVAKVQMFFFTMVAVFVYGGALFKWLSGGGALADPTAIFPPLSQGLIAILGISHAGFLAKQSTSETPTK